MNTKIYCYHIRDNNGQKIVGGLLAYNYDDAARRVISDLEIKENKHGGDADAEDGPEEWYTYDLLRDGKKVHAYLSIHPENITEEADDRVVTCVFCGQAYPQGTPTHGAQVLTEHIRVCEKHPMRKVEKRLDDILVLVHKYLEHPSLDGHPLRQELRKQLAQAAESAACSNI